MLGGVSWYTVPKCCGRGMATTMTMTIVRANESGPIAGLMR